MQQDLKTIIQYQEIKEQQQLEQYVQKLNKIKNIVENLIQQLQQQYDKELKEYKSKISELFQQQDNTKYSLLIDEVLHFRIQYAANTNNRECLEQIVKTCEEFKMFSQFFQGVEYHDHILKENMRYNGIYGYQISKNEKYLFVAYSMEIQITQLVNKKSIQRQVMQRNSNCKLSDDSLYLYYATESGYIYCYSIKKLKLIYKANIQKQFIHYLKPINNNQLLILQKSRPFISVLDLKSKSVVKKIQDEKNLTEHLNSFGYDQFEQVVIAGYSNHSIKIFSIDGYLLIIRQKAHQQFINNIQVLNNGNFISICGKQLSIWRADYNLKALTIIKQFLPSRYIYACQSLLDNQIIIIVHQTIIKIYDKDFNLIQTIQHGVSISGGQSNETNQSDNLNYIVIKGESHVKVMKKYVK